jgi:hypothetical protein
MMTMKTTTANKVWFGAALLFVAVAVAAAQVPGFFSICNAITGYQVNSVAPNGQVICGNGTVGTYSASCAINAATAAALAATPTQCAAGQNATGINANGNANCTVAATQTDVTGSRSFGSTYHNVGTIPLFIQGYGQITGGSGDSQISCLAGPSSASVTIWSMTDSFTIPGEPAGFACMIAPGYYYSVAVVHDISSTPNQWNETPIP